MATDPVLCDAKVNEGDGISRRESRHRIRHVRRRGANMDSILRDFVGGCRLLVAPIMYLEDIGFNTNGITIISRCSNINQIGI